MKIDEEKRTLTADEGFILTNDSTYGSIVKLGDWDSVDNWREITLEEHAKIVEEQEKRLPDRYEQH